MLSPLIFQNQNFNYDISKIKEKKLISLNVLKKSNQKPKIIWPNTTY